ncbi:MAG: DUF2891 domain-containing protein [Sorangiineae bacterium]|nr:DUF2891 domain-containing protein [Polyangiaceae bacterium]MEB2324888.1 DUF2891 domain-containing protein [Sorangiineae bacterium]
MARLALASVGREYPSQLAHVLFSDADAAPPRLLTPAFFGAYDWHSAVHGHFTLARAARVAPGGALERAARTALGRALTVENIAAEVSYAQARAGFELPYGAAWLLTLAAELGGWDDPDACEWSRALAPLERLSAERLGAWLERLPAPVRSGEHSQSMFATGLLLDWARARGRDERRVAERVRELHERDRDGPLHLEPSAFDFLSPCLATADLMRRVLSPEPFAAWLTRFLPRLELTPARCPDPSDGKLAHLDGLNLSRAWMLASIARALPAADPRRAPLAESARVHLGAGLAQVTGEHYEGAHWLGTFALYALTS